jgi:hypothetical protein
MHTPQALGKCACAPLPEAREREERVAGPEREERVAAGESEVRGAGTVVLWVMRTFFAASRFGRSLAEAAPLSFSLPAPLSAIVPCFSCPQQPLHLMRFSTAPRCRCLSRQGALDAAPTTRRLKSSSTRHGRPPIFTEVCARRGPALGFLSPCGSVRPGPRYGEGAARKVHAPGCPVPIFSSWASPQCLVSAVSVTS